MPDTKKSDGVLPVRLVLRRTGLSADVLRAWERRYGAVHPERSAGGQRLYREVDVVRLEKLRRLTILGHSIGQVARLTDPQLDVLLPGSDHAPAESQARPRRDDAELTPDGLRANCLKAIERMDALLLDATLRRAAISLGPVAFAERVVGPLVVQVGELWHRGTLRVGQEHLASSTIRSVLSWLCRASSPQAGQGTLLVATTQGQRHELGAMMAAAVASAEGWNAVYLGPDLPVEEIAEAARSTDAAAIALSFVLPTTGGEVEDRIRQLRGLVRQEVTVFVGGSASNAVASRLERYGVTHVSTLASFRDHLRRAP
ncbi:MAG: MerR family transcriptional regulator [Gemmatimonadaceae bacterium]